MSLAGKGMMSEATKLARISFLQEVEYAQGVPPPRYHTVKYAGVLAAASPWRSRIAPACPDAIGSTDKEQEREPKRRGGYRPWAELLKRTFEIDVLSCPTCQGRMRLLAMVTDSKSIRRYLARVGEPTESPAHSPSRGPPFWKSVVLRQKMLGGADLGA